MGRYLSWLANALLLATCCFLAANTANAVIAAMLAPSPDETAPSQGTASSGGRSWEDRQVIIERNLFNAALIAPPPKPEPVLEILESTTLPLELIGTVASPNPALSWAAVQDHESRQHLILQVNDEVKGKARVERIERKRVVFSENGKLSELAIGDPEPVPEPKQRPQRAAARPTSRKRAAAAAAVAKQREIAARRAAQQAAERAAEQASPLRNAAALFSDADLRPKMQDGEMVGMEVQGIQPGSVFERIGLEDGDVITELNGIRINSPQESTRALAELVDAKEYVFTVQGPEGGEETLRVNPEE